MTTRPSALEPLRARVRRFQLIVGLGMITVVVGSLLASALFARISGALSELPSPVRFVSGVLIYRLWVLALLPALSYGLARVLSLRPWSTGIGAAVAGESFILAIDFVQDGFDSLLSQPGFAASRFVTVAAGAVLTALAVKSGRAKAALAERRAQEAAAAKKAEYEAFAQASAAHADRVEQRAEAPPAPAVAAGAPSSVATPSPSPSPAAEVEDLSRATPSPRDPASLEPSGGSSSASSTPSVPTADADEPVADVSRATPYPRDPRKLD